jgi:hypothetical protein
MAARAKPQDDKFIQMTVDDKWLAEYTEKVKQFGGTIEEYEKEAVTDQADLTDVVEKQEEQVQKAASSPLPKTKDQIKQDKELNAALQRGKAQTTNEKKLHERAKRMDAASDERVAKEKERELDVQRKEAEREEDKRASTSVRDVRHVTQGVNKALENVNPLLERAGTLPTLGGIGLMIGILAFLLILIVPVNAAGDTRAKQFWYMLNGRAKLQGAVSPVVGSQITGVSGDFGPGSAGTPNTIVPPGTTPTTPGSNGFSSTFRATPGNLGF